MPHTYDNTKNEPSNAEASLKTVKLQNRGWSGDLLLQQPFLPLHIFPVHFGYHASWKPLPSQLRLRWNSPFYFWPL